MGSCLFLQRIGQNLKEAKKILAKIQQHSLKQTVSKSYETLDKNRKQCVGSFIPKKTGSVIV